MLSLIHYQLVAWGLRFFPLNCYLIISLPRQYRAVKKGWIGLMKKPQQLYNLITHVGTHHTHQQRKFQNIFHLRRKENQFNSNRLRAQPVPYTKGLRRNFSLVYAFSFSHKIKIALWFGIPYWGLYQYYITEQTFFFIKIGGDNFYIGFWSIRLLQVYCVSLLEVTTNVIITSVSD